MQESIYINQKNKSLKLKDKLISVLWITLFWLILGIYQYYDRYSILLDKNFIDASYKHWPHIKGILISITLAGLFLGPSIVFLWERWLRRLVFSRALSYIVICYTSLYIFLTFFTIVIFAQDNPSILIDNSILKTIANSLFSFNTLPNFLFWLFVLLLTMIFLLIRDKFGPNMFWGFLRGKYFRPKKEERIFMFMDLNSATTIAEKLGEEKYFNFLNDTYKTVTHGILTAKGEIYQYVGDEIVISWEKDIGLYKLNCIQCYFEMIKNLDQHKNYFQEMYGVIPKFKAGLHSGFVIAGEIGIIKRDIVYSGDVLNTASRIQSLCNELGAKILISRNLVTQIDKSYTKNLISLGEINLKGKRDKIELFTIKKLEV